MIITLCGSARFEPWFHMWNRALGLAGHCVFGLSSYPSQNEGDKDWYTPEQKEVLDKVHFDKIKASDAILVLNCFAYIGESTLRELEYAKHLGRRVYMLESWGEGYGISINHTKEWRDSTRLTVCPRTTNLRSMLPLAVARVLRCLGHDAARRSRRETQCHRGHAEKGRERGAVSCSLTTRTCNDIRCTL